MSTLPSDCPWPTIVWQGELLADFAAELGTHTRLQRREAFLRSLEPADGPSGGKGR